MQRVGLERGVRTIVALASGAIQWRHKIMQKRLLSCVLKIVMFELSHLLLEMNSNWVTFSEAGAWECPVVDVWEVLFGSWQKNMQ